MLLLTYSLGVGGGFGDVGPGLAYRVLGGESALGWYLGTALNCCVILFLTLWASVSPSVHFRVHDLHPALKWALPAPPQHPHAQNSIRRSNPRMLLNLSSDNPDLSHSSKHLLST